jgi:predicted transposase/invertase (TIGR01784 family)
VERLLDPKNDVVFKLLMVRYPHVLMGLLNAVLRPPSPIVSVEISNPELPKNVADDKGAFLDVLAWFQDGLRADVEMQIDIPLGLRSRILYYWAKLYASPLVAGQPHSALRPCYSVVILGKNLWTTPRYHSVFELFERHDHTLFSPDMALHTLELPKLATLLPGELETDPDPIDWGRFFAAQTEQELEDLVMQRPDMVEPVKALTQLSADDKARIAAFERECALGGWEIIMNATREESEAKGRAEGQAEALVAVLAARGLSVSSVQREQILGTRDLAVLDRWLRRAMVVRTADELFDP